MGFNPNGNGPAGARYGRCDETGRAFKADGTVRKARMVQSPEQQLADLALAEQRAQAGMGRKVMQGMGRFARFLAAFGQFRSWVREAKAHGSDEATAKRRAALEQQLADLDAKQDAAVAFLDAQGDAIDEANGVFARVGAAYIAFSKANGRAPNADEGEALVAEAIDAEAIEAVESAADPANDPFAAFRRNAEAEQASDEDDDTL